MLGTAREGPVAKSGPAWDAPTAATASVKPLTGFAAEFGDDPLPADHRPPLEGQPDD